MSQSMKLFLPLDYPNADDAWSMFELIKPHNPYFKVGMELFGAAGPEFVERLVSAGAEVFLDLKYHDIPNTVAGAIRQAARLNVKYVNLHILGGQKMVEGARTALDQACSGSKSPALLGVTLLTSIENNDLSILGMDGVVQDRVVELARLGKSWGLDGVVCSTAELQAIRAELGKDFLTMVPGIRPAGSAVGDQKRVATPAEAASGGADCIVVGRPIRNADDPVAILKSILDTL